MSPNPPCIPSPDGNGRIGRLLIVLHLLTQGVLVEPTLTVCPWFEGLGISYGRANGLVGRLVQLGVLAPVDGGGGTRRSYAPEAYRVLVKWQ